MSFYEKYVNSKFYHIADLLLKFVLLNILMIITTVVGLGIIGLPLALLSGVLTSKIILQKGSNGVIKIYINILKKIFKKSFKSIIMFSLLLIILGYNLVFFYSGLEPFSWYYLFSFMIMFILFLFTVIAYMHSLILVNLYNLSFKSLAKHSYLLTIGFSVRGILWLVGMFLLIYIMILMPIIGLLVGFSCISIITFYLLTTGYQKIEALDDLLEEFIEKIVY